MTSNADSRSLTPRVAAPDRVGQATAVEQSRAVAQVEAQVIVARRFPRHVAAATAAMREACAHERLAEKAFYRFPRGGAMVSGPSIHLARELARVWGNIEYGVHEMRRDDAARQSEMLAFAWDLETNARTSLVFINPHMRDKSGGPEPLTDMRDIYEGNANAGARRVREAVFAVLPTWFVEEAIDRCNKTLSEGGGKPLAQRVADAVAAFAKLGVTTGQIESKLGRKSPDWIDQDIAQLQVIYRSLERGEISKDDEFPPERVTRDEILGQPKAPAEAAAEPGADAGPPLRRPPVTVPPAGDPAPDATPEPISASDFGKLLASIPLGPAVKDVHEFLSWRVSRKVSNLKDISAEERAAIAAYIREAQEAAGGDPDETAAAIWTQYREEFPPHLWPSWKLPDGAVPGEGGQAQS